MSALRTAGGSGGIASAAGGGFRATVGQTPRPRPPGCARGALAAAARGERCGEGGLQQHNGKEEGGGRGCAGRAERCMCAACGVSHRACSLPACGDGDRGWNAAGIAGERRHGDARGRQRARHGQVRGASRPPPPCPPPHTRGCRCPRVKIAAPPSVTEMTFRGRGRRKRRPLAPRSRRRAAAARGRDPRGAARGRALRQAAGGRSPLLSAWHRARG